MLRMGFWQLASHTPRALSDEDAMHDPRPRSRGHLHSRRERGWRGRLLGQRRDETPAERTLRIARRRAARKFGFIAHLVPYTMTCLFLTVVAGPRVGLVAALSWGIGVACHGFFALVSPELRQRLIDAEVERELREQSGAQRREIEGRHARSLEELSASIAHEIRNPVTAAKSLVQQMGEDPASRENVTYARVALEELDRVERSISHLLRFARDEELRVSELALPEVVQSALDSLRERIQQLGVKVRFEPESPGAMRGDAEKLRRVWINLLGNALDALDEAGTRDPELRIELGENLAGSELWLRVRDNGPGIPAELQRRIWSPFYTSKASGTGLGLALAKKVVEAHGGRIELEDAGGPAGARGPGACFLVTLPKRPPPDSEAANPRGAAL